MIGVAGYPSRSGHILTRSLDAAYDADVANRCSIVLISRAFEKIGAARLRVQQGLWLEHAEKAAEEKVQIDDARPLMALSTQASPNSGRPSDGRCISIRPRA